MVKADIDEVKRLNLKRLMKERNMGPKRLADMMGVSQSYISSLLKGGKEGGRNVGKKTVLKIGKALNIEEYEFYNLEVTGKSSENKNSQGYTDREIQHMENSAAANKELNEYLKNENKKLKRQVEVLMVTIEKLKKSWVDGRRQGDAEGLDVKSLRKQSNKEK